MARVLVVSNRLPVTVKKRKGALRYEPSAGGLAVGLRSVYRSEHGMWIGWPGLAREKTGSEERAAIAARLAEERCHPVFLTRAQVDRYYLGFSNRTLWPQAHYFTQYTTYDRSLWQAYRDVNEVFAEAVLEVAQPDDTIWVHDYQLMLLPGMLRERLPRARIGYFLHIPFPDFEVFRALPWREDLLRGLLGADLVGFHTYGYALHFLDCVRRLLGHEHHLGRITIGRRVVRTGAFPMGIDYARYADAAGREDVQACIARLREEMLGRRLILSVDRMDYSKGIPERLAAFARMLELHPEHRGKVVLVLVGVPSRTEVEHYRTLKRRVNEAISDINGTYGRLGWVPVWYMYRNLPFEELCALYHEADVCLVTPLRDGMNLVAKEYVATRGDARGVLVLSEMAGAAKELPEAVIVNPNNTDAIAAALQRALTMPGIEREARMRPMQERLRRRDVGAWAHHFLEDLAASAAFSEELAARHLDDAARARLVAAYERSAKRLLLLDCDGTLLGFRERPERVEADEALIGLLDRLQRARRNTVALISGRDRETLERWFGGLRIALVAEHGAWVREPGRPWVQRARSDTSWKDEVRPILELYGAGTPGAFVEEKSFSLAWHYRQAEPSLAAVSASELKGALTALAAPLQLGIVQGNRVVEVRDISVNKGAAVAEWLPDHAGAFVLSMGDDTTDEDMFAALPADAWTVKVGFAPTRARHWVEGPEDVRALLGALAGTSASAARR